MPAPRLKTVFACQACGFESSKWLGRCPDCGEWNSFVEERQEASSPVRGKAPGVVFGGRPQAYDVVDGTDAERIPTGLAEFDRVLGGGIVPGSMVLIGGEPGILRRGIEVGEVPYRQLRAAGGLPGIER